MAAAPPSYTKVTHNATYDGITPTQPGLSTAGKVVLITGASGGIGRATASSFAASGPKALILLGRRADALAETASIVKASYGGLPIQTYEAELCDASSVRDALNKAAAECGGIDILVHAAGVLAPVEPLLEADPTTFLDGYKTTVLGTLVTAQSVVRANPDKPVTFVNLTTAGILFPPFPGMGAYVSSKLAVVKLLEAFAAENPQVRLHNVHPGFLQTAMSAKLAEKVKLPMAYDDSKDHPNLIPLYLAGIHRSKSLTILLRRSQSRCPPISSSGLRPPKPSFSRTRSSSPPGTWKSSRLARRRSSVARQEPVSCGSDSADFHDLSLATLCPAGVERLVMCTKKHERHQSRCRIACETRRKTPRHKRTVRVMPAHVTP